MTPAIATDARPRGPTAKRQPSPEGLGNRPEKDPSAVGAALFRGSKSISRKGPRNTVAWALVRQLFHPTTANEAGWGQPAPAACYRCRPLAQRAFQRSPFSSSAAGQEGAGQFPAGLELPRPASPPAAEATPAFRCPACGSDGGLLADAKKLLEHIPLIAGA